MMNVDAGSRRKNVDKQECIFILQLSAYSESSKAKRLS